MCNFNLCKKLYKYKIMKFGNPVMLKFNAIQEQLGTVSVPTFFSDAGKTFHCELNLYDDLRKCLIDRKIHQLTAN